MSRIIVVDIFHQNTETYEEAEAWIRQNAANAEDFI